VCQFKGLTLHLLAKPGRGLTKGGVVAQHRVAEARHLVGHGAGGLVVIGSGLHLQHPVTHAAELEPLSFATEAARITERAPWVSSMRKYWSPILEMRPRRRVLPDELSLGVSPNQEAK